MDSTNNKLLKTKVINIGQRLIGDSQPCYIIAEIGINHNGSLQIARQLIKLASESGANAVKFQKRDISNLYQKEYLNQPLAGHRGIQYILPQLKDYELSEEDYFQILDYCKEYSIQFLCTPFDKKSVDFLEKLNVPAYKIGSPDLTNFDLLEYVCSKQKPLLVSTGMSTFAEIEKTVEFLKKLNAEFILLHCNSNYPAPFHQINLRVMPFLREKFSCLVGYSGHEYGISVSQAAVVLGACIVERHFTLDRTMIGPDHAASLEPVGLKTLIRDIRQIEIALGSNLRFMDRGEFMNREVLGKSLVAKKKIKKGEIITREMVICKSPGTGISPQKIYQLLGKRALRNIEQDEQFKEEDLLDKIKIKNKKFKFKHPFGIMVRPTDYQELIKIFSPKVAEFHLTDNDIESNFKIKKDYSQELIIHAPEYCNHDLFDLSCEEKRILEKSKKNLEKLIKLTKTIKKSFPKSNKVKIVLHPGGMYQSGPFGLTDFDLPSKKRLYRNLAFSLETFTQDWYEILIENMPPFPWYFGGQWLHGIFMDAQEIIDFCKETKRFICLDISHAKLYCNYKKIDYYNYLNSLIPYAKHLHIADASDGVDGEGLQINEGSIDFKKLKFLFDKFQGSFSVEIWQGHKEKGKGFWEALKRLKKMKIL